MAQLVFSGTITPEITLIIDEASSTVTYIGKAKLGSSEADPVWQIRRIEKSGTVTKLQFANGSRRFNQIWDNRASLSYTN